MDSLLSWEEANQYCLSTYGTYLATIITDSDHQIARNIVGIKSTDNRNPWIGLTDKFIEGHWQWIDGTSCDYTSTGSCIDDIHWNVNEPNNKRNEEHYAEMRYIDGLYNDEGNDPSSRPFICNNPQYGNISNATSNQIPSPTEPLSS